jgi:hypothetical protein
MHVMTPWADYSRPPMYTISADDIVTDSVVGLGVSSISDLVNQPAFKFHFSEASKYRTSARIQRVDTAASVVNESNVNEYASGFPNSSIALSAWRACNDSWRKYGMARTEDIELRTVPAESLWPAIGGANGSLSRVEWMASRHRTVEVTISDTHIASRVPLGAIIDVQQKRYIKTPTRGIVVSRAWDPLDNVVTLGLMLNAAELEIGLTDLVDTIGSGFDTIDDTIDTMADTLIDTLEA